MRTQRQRIQAYNRLVTLFVTLGILTVGLHALPPPPQPRNRIILEHADSLIFNRDINPDARKLIGNVRFRHGNAFMTCDSAYHYPVTNSFEAFGRVYMNQADSVFLNADRLFYDGEMRLAKFRDQVKLSKEGTTLYTDSLDYDRNTNIGKYSYGGTIVDSLNTLSSIFGYYDTESDDAEFQDSVHLENPNFDLTTEILQYNTRSKVAHILGPTLIKSDSGDIYSTRGVYDTERDLGILLDRSTVYSKEYILTGDSLYYDKKMKFGEAFGNMILTDTANKAQLYGQYGYFDQSRNYAFATERAYLKEYSKPDTAYISADSLELISYREWPQPRIVSHRVSSSAQPHPGSGTDSISLTDTIAGSGMQSRTDSIQPVLRSDTIYPTDSIVRRIIKGYHNVRVYRKDIQAIGDSLSYVSADSLISFFGHPIAWNEQSQISGDTLNAYLRNDSLDYVTAQSRAMGIRQLSDTAKFDQISAQLLKAYFQDSTVRDLEAVGQVETILFLEKKKKGRYSSFKRMTGPMLQAHIEADTLQKAKWFGPAEGKVYPIRMAASDTARLPGFNWEVSARPQGPQDLFRDSIPGVYHPPSLASLRRFSGAAAAIYAYDEIVSRRISRLGKAAGSLVDSTATDPLGGLNAPSTSEQPHTKIASELSPFIRRPLSTDPLPQFITPSSFIDLWLYFPSSDTAPHENSTTSRSTGIQTRKDFRDE